MWRHLRLALAVLLLAIGTPVTADGGPEWGSMSHDEREVLREHADRWPGYSPAQRFKLQDGARRYLDLSPGERRVIRDRADRFDSMDEQEKRRLCLRYYHERGQVPPSCRPYLAR